LKINKILKFSVPGVNPACGCGFDDQHYFITTGNQSAVSAFCLLGVGPGACQTKNQTGRSGGQMTKVDFATAAFFRNGSRVAVEPRGVIGRRSQYGFLTDTLTDTWRHA
jgi:hypothetical protein